MSTPTLITLPEQPIDLSKGAWAPLDYVGRAAWYQSATHLPAAKPVEDQSLLPSAGWAGQTLVAVPTREDGKPSHLVDHGIVIDPTIPGGHYLAKALRPLGACGWIGFDTDGQVVIDTDLVQATGNLRASMVDQIAPTVIAAIRTMRRLEDEYGMEGRFKRLTVDYAERLMIALRVRGQDIEVGGGVTDSGALDLIVGHVSILARTTGLSPEKVRALFKPATLVQPVGGDWIEEHWVRQAAWYHTEDAVMRRAENGILSVVPVDHSRTVWIGSLLVDADLADDPQARALADAGLVGWVGTDMSGRRVLSSDLARTPLVNHEATPGKGLDRLSVQRVLAAVPAGRGIIERAKDQGLPEVIVSALAAGDLVVTCGGGRRMLRLPVVDGRVSLPSTVTPTQAAMTLGAHGKGAHAKAMAVLGA